MRPRTLALVGSLAVVAAALSASSGSLEDSGAEPVAKASTPRRRTTDGHPDLQGVYDVATMTPLERPAGVQERSR